MFIIKIYNLDEENNRFYFICAMPYLTLIVATLFVAKTKSRWPVQLLTHSVREAWNVNK
jgi:hypothetical protein